jgi:hypothetical protein
MATREIAISRCFLIDFVLYSLHALVADLDEFRLGALVMMRLFEQLLFHRRFRREACFRG